MIQHPIAPPAPSRWTPGPQQRMPAGPRPPVPAVPLPRSAPPAHLPAARPAWPAPAGVLPHPVPQTGPRLLWVGLAWLLFGVLVLAGVGTAVAASAGSGPGPDQFFGSGEVATLELDPATEPVIYTALAGDGGYVTCEPVGPSATGLDLASTTTDWSVQVDGREWHAAFHLLPAEAGSYQIRCSGVGATFALGDQVDGAGGVLVALIVLPLVGLVTAAATTAVVLVRRRAAQDRLLGGWSTAPAPRW